MRRRRSALTLAITIGPSATSATPRCTTVMESPVTWAPSPRSNSPSFMPIIAVPE